MKIIYNNEVLNATLTGTSVNPDYPLANLLDNNSLNYYRSIADTGVRVVIDKSSVNADWFFILNHNISSGATIKLEGNTSDSWGSPAFSETVTWNVDTIYHSFTSATYDFWSLSVEDGSNPDGFIQIGLLDLGPSLTMPGFLRTLKISKIDTSKTVISEDNVPSTDIRLTYRLINPSFPAYNETVNKQLETMFDFAKDYGGKVMVVIWEESLAVQPPMYAILPKVYDANKLDNSGLIYTTQMELREIK